jgi:hypothetical protein
MNLFDIPIIDTHAHAFYPEKENSDFRVFFNQSLWFPEMEIVKHTLINSTMINELKKKLDLSPDLDQEEVVKIRNKLYKKDAKSYVKKLFESLNIDTLIIDTGIPSKDNLGYEVDLKYFAELMNAKIKTVLRLDNLINRILLLHPKSYLEAKELFDNELDLKINDNQLVGIKSYIAYESGLDIKRYDDFTIKNAYDRYGSNINFEDKKILHDSFTLIGLKKCKENDIVMQFHTGFGSPPALDVVKANPILLENILGEEDTRDTKVMLLHSGIPYSSEAAFLTSTLPRCYCDLSGIIVNFCTAFKKAISDVLEYGSFKRITFGTDGLMAPETYYMSYILGIRMIGEVLDEFVKGKYISRNEAEEIGQMIINTNAKEIFKL